MAATSIAFSSGQAVATSKRTANIMIVDADPVMWGYIRGLLGDEYAVTSSPTYTEAIAKLKGGFTPDLIFLDVHNFDNDGLMILADLRSASSMVPIVLLSSASDTRQIVRAMRLGARDIVQKPFGKSELRGVVQSCLGTADLHLVNETHEIPLDDNTSFVHSSKRMKDIRSQCSLVARVDLPVLILGESGTGKEVLAQYIHKTSPRAHRTFLKINCAAMPADLLESELFGYEQGAFTGAVKAKPGKFEICNHGTILLDEIGEMPASLQAKLLQVLQDGSFSRLGSRTTIKVDVRVIAATNIDMKASIAQKKFREDLYYRLNGFTLSLPPLRERKEEIPVLMQYFMRKLSEKYGRQPLAMSSELLQACVNYAWPGNLRELENFVKRYIVLADEQLMVDEISPRRPEATMIAADNSAARGLKGLVRSMKDDAEAVAIARALDSTRWNRKQAAAELQISYKALLYKIKQYNLTPPANA